MRSSCSIWVGSKFHGKFPYKKSQSCAGRMPCEVRGKDWDDVATASTDITDMM